MKTFSFIFSLLKNKYFLAVVIFAVWVSFFDRNDLFTQYDRKQELKKLETSAAFYQKEIANTKKDLTDLNNNPAILEKVARENYYLKKANEEIFLVDDSLDKKN